MCLPLVVITLFNYFLCILLVCTRKTRVLDVVYNASNNELVRTKTLVKNCIVQVDATPFRAWYEQHYGVKVGQKKIKKSGTTEDVRLLSIVFCNVFLCVRDTCDVFFICPIIILSCILCLSVSRLVGHQEVQEPPEEAC